VSRSRFYRFVLFHYCRRTELRARYRGPVATRVTTAHVHTRTALLVISQVPRNVFLSKVFSHPLDSSRAFDNNYDNTKKTITEPEGCRPSVIIIIIYIFFFNTRFSALSRVFDRRYLRCGRYDDNQHAGQQ